MGCDGNVRRQRLVVSGTRLRNCTGVSSQKHLPHCCAADFLVKRRRQLNGSATTVQRPPDTPRATQPLHDSSAPPSHGEASSPSSARRDIDAHEQESSINCDATPDSASPITFASHARKRFLISHDVHSTCGRHSRHVSHSLRGTDSNRVRLTLHVGPTQR